MRARLSALVPLLWALSAPAHAAGLVDLLARAAAYDGEGVDGECARWLDAAGSHAPVTEVALAWALRARARELSGEGDAAQAAAEALARCPSPDGGCEQAWALALPASLIAADASAAQFAEAALALPADPAVLGALRARLLLLAFQNEPEDAEERLAQVEAAIGALPEGPARVQLSGRLLGVRADRGDLPVEVRIELRERGIAMLSAPGAGPPGVSASALAWLREELADDLEEAGRWSEAESTWRALLHFYEAQPELLPGARADAMAGVARSVEEQPGREADAAATWAVLASLDPAGDPEAVRWVAVGRDDLADRQLEAGDCEAAIATRQSILGLVPQMTGRAQESWRYWGHFDLGEAYDVCDEAGPACEQLALAAAAAPACTWCDDPGADALRSQALAARACWKADRNDDARALVDATLALATSQEAPSPYMLAIARMVDGLLLGDEGRVRDALFALDAAGEAGEQAWGRAAILEARVRQAWIAWDHDLQQAQRILETGLYEARAWKDEAELRYWLGRATFELSEIYRELGRRRAADRALRRADELSRGVDDPRHRALLVADIVSTQADGRPASRRVPLFARGLAEVRAALPDRYLRDTHWRMAGESALALEEDGRPAEAVEAYGEALIALQALDADDPSRTWALPLAHSSRGWLREALGDCPGSLEDHREAARLWATVPRGPGPAFESTQERAELEYEVLRDGSADAFSCDDAALAWELSGAALALLPEVGEREPAERYRLWERRALTSWARDDLQEALHAADAALAANAEDPSAQLRQLRPVHLRIVRGYILRELARPTEALAQLDASLAELQLLAPLLGGLDALPVAEVATSRAVLLVELGRFAEAAAAALEALPLLPADRPTERADLSMVAVDGLLGAGRWAEALVVADGALVELPDGPTGPDLVGHRVELQLARGLAQVGLGEREAARASLSAASAELVHAPAAERPMLQLQVDLRAIEVHGAARDPAAVQAVLTEAETHLEAIDDPVLRDRLFLHLHATAWLALGEVDVHAVQAELARRSSARAWQSATTDAERVDACGLLSWSAVNLALDGRAAVRRVDEALACLEGVADPAARLPARASLLVQRVLYQAVARGHISDADEAMVEAAVQEVPGEAPRAWARLEAGVGMAVIALAMQDPNGLKRAVQEAAEAWQDLSATRAQDAELVELGVRLALAEVALHRDAGRGKEAESALVAGRERLVALPEGAGRQALLLDLAAAEVGLLQDAGQVQRAAALAEEATQTLLAWPAHVSVPEQVVAALDLQVDALSLAGRFDEAGPLLEAQQVWAARLADPFERHDAVLEVHLERMALSERAGVLGITDLDRTGRAERGREGLSGARTARLLAAVARMMQAMADQDGEALLRSVDQLGRQMRGVGSLRGQRVAFLLMHAELAQGLGEERAAWRSLHRVEVRVRQERMPISSAQRVTLHRLRAVRAVSRDHLRGSLEATQDWYLAAADLADAYDRHRNRLMAASTLALIGEDTAASRRWTHPAIQRGRPLVDLPLHELTVELLREGRRAAARRILRVAFLELASEATRHVGGRQQAFGQVGWEAAMFGVEDAEFGSDALALELVLGAEEVLLGPPGLPASDDVPCWQETVAVLAAGGRARATTPHAACGGRPLPRDPAHAVLTLAEAILPPGAAQPSDRDPVQALRDRLDGEGAWLVRYVVVPGEDDEARYLALVVPPQGELRRVELGSVAEVDARVAGWYTHLAARPERPDAPLSAAGREAGQALRAVLWDSLALGPGPVWVVPDGTLHMVPFHALPTDTGWLFQQRRIGVLPGSSLLLRDATRSPRSGALLLAGPDAAAPPAPPDQPSRPPTEVVDCMGPQGLASHDQRSSIAGAGLPPLHCAETEGMVVAEALRASGTPVELRVGAWASEGALRAGASHARLLHVASHGFAAASTVDVPDAPLLRSSPFRPGGSTDATSAVSRVPELNAGLLLAGSGQQGPLSPVDDGLFTAAEVRTLDLEGVDLVVLSSCVSGLGLPTGRTVAGFRSAFFAAGARNLLASTWPVDDAETGRWMSAFYTALATSDGDAVTATSQAMQARLDDGVTHPYYWAPFTLSGTGTVTADPSAQGP